MHRLMKIGAAKHQDILQMILARITWHKREIFAATLWKQAVAAANWELGPWSRSTGSRVEMDQMCILKEHGLMSCRWLPSSLHPAPFLNYRCAWCSLYLYRDYMTGLPTAGLYLGTKDSIEDLNTNFKVKEHKSQIVKALYWICFFGPGGL